jgi:RNA polymerase sigma factor (sigma-70 family)
MRTTGRGGPDTAMVIKARDGDVPALDALVSDSLPLVYNIVGRALHGHADVDDVVQETFLRMVRGLHDLRDPEAYRSWLVAIAIRQVRDHEQDRRTAHVRSTALDIAQEVPDPASDFAAVTILRLGLTDQRREVAQATRWLDPDDQALLALWWLEESGELDRAHLAGALGLSGQHTAVRVRRMKDQIDIARSVVRALQNDPGCHALREVTYEWDGTPSPLWRKRLARHVRECEVCGHQGAEPLPIERLLASLPLLPVPAALVARTLHGTRQAAGALRPNIAHHASSRAAGHSLRSGLRAANAKGAGAHAGLSIASSGMVAPVSAVAVALSLAAGVALAVHVASAPSAAGSPLPSARSTPLIVPSTAAAVPRPSLSLTLSHSPSPSPSPSRSASPTPRPTPVQLPPVVVPASSSRKGVSVWTFSGVDQALTESGAGWYYTWSTSHSGISSSASVGFVPMIWGASSVTAANLAQAKSSGPYLLGFNEPDMSSQSNMTVAQALDLWPQLMATGMTLGSPAVASGADTPGSWLDQFMTGAAAKGYRVNFITLHWYGSDFDTSDAVSQLQSYIEAVHNRYHLPIWLTEYALTGFADGGTQYPTEQQQAAFVTASTKMLDSLPYVQRYAWFALPASDTGASTGLFQSGPVANVVGKAFEAAD